MSQSITLGLFCICKILNNAFGKAKQYVCNEEMYCFCVLTDFHKLQDLKFGTAMEI